VVHGFKVRRDEIYQIQRLAWAAGLFMTVMTDNLLQLLSTIARLPETPQGELNFFSSGGRGYLENPTSDLLGLFKRATSHVPCWLNKVLPHYWPVDTYEELVTQALACTERRSAFSLSANCRFSTVNSCNTSERWVIPQGVVS